MKRETMTVAEYRALTRTAEQAPAPRRTPAGFRDDLGHLCRSRWEANYARYLRWLIAAGVYRSYQYEPFRFEFPVPRGVRSYLPDFWVELPDGRHEVHEVKGYERREGMVALRRMARYYPEVTVLVIDREHYGAIARDYARRLPGWEFGRRNER